jgi:hypothetical protein
MKKLILWIAMLFGIQGLFAQPVLNHNLNFAIGDSYRIDGYNLVTNLNPGGPGGNQVWDFEVIEGEDFFEGETAICVNPATTPFADSAGAAEANIAIKPLDSESGAYQYYKTSASSRELLAMGWYETGNTSFTHYLNSNTDLLFPLAYGDEFDFDTELLMYSVDMGFYVMRDSGHVTTEADAWGSITTPVETYPNVLRLKTTSVMHSWYRFDISEPWMYLGEFTDISYDWYAPNIKVPVLSIMEFLFAKGGSEMYALHFLAEYQFPTGIENVEKNDFSLYPNPASDIVRVTGGDDWLAGEIIIYDQQGREMLRQKSGNGRVNVAGLKTGCYFVEMKAGINTRIRKLIIN